MEMAQSPAAFAIVTAATVSLCSFIFIPPNFCFVLFYVVSFHSGSLLPHCVSHLYKWREPLETGYHLHSNNSITHTQK